MANCNVCCSSLDGPVFRSEGTSSITSLSEIYPGKTEVFFCERCGHLQTTEVGDLDDYYDKSYKLFTDSEEEDQLYEVRDGEKYYRVEHQVQTLLSKVSLPQAASVLDYGCGKSGTLRNLSRSRSGVTPYLFDVSDVYVPFWEKFAAPEHWATYELPKEWTELFDLATSFFTLEHVANPRDALMKVRSLLKPDGVYYFIVPNVFTNIADFVVVDHVNHFTDTSLSWILRRAGFEVLEVDGDVHRGAFVVVAKKAPPTDEPGDNWDSRVAEVRQKMEEVRGFWQGASRRVQQFEKQHAAGAKVAIYGSGFYGGFLLTCLSERERVDCFIDQSQFRQGKELFGVPIRSPDSLDAEIDVIYVGLNPQIARASIEGVEAWRDRNHEYFYL